ncbi:hypothetical protein OSTOST_14121, partial [Ostertagia ostertagi]
KEQKGYVNRLDFKVNNITAETVDHPQHIDIVKVILPTPLPPGAKITISTPFHVRLPYNFSRGGHDGQSYQATQWYPKPAVYDREGWHPMPYLDQGEFYSEFGSFDVRITVPANYVVAATGELQDQQEKQWLAARQSFNWTPVKKKIKLKSGSYKTVYDEFPPSANDIKTVRFTQNNVHDFAWFADKRFIVDHDTCQLASGRTFQSLTANDSPKAWASDMAASDDIRFVQHDSIDLQKWDRCINEASNGLVYVSSFYLDHMAAHWDALVMGDYAVVMPLTWNKKYGIHYLYQPFLVAQGGIFGKNITPDTITSFIEAIPKKFRLVEISMNTGNLFNITSKQGLLRVNYVLDLKKPYDQLYAGYRDNIKRNIRKAL